MDESELWRSRAVSSWQACERAGIRRRGGRARVKEPAGLRAVPLWPFSQVLHTATVLSDAHLIARRVPHELLVTLETYRAGTAYAERPTNKRRYFDDNAWIALALIDYGTKDSLDSAARIFRFLEQGSDVIPNVGVGVRWVESGFNHHACSTGSTGLVAIRLAHRNLLDRSQAFEFAGGCADFLVSLVDQEGLVRDHRRPDGSIDGAVYTYNQGLAIGLLAEMGRRDQAVELADRTIAAFGFDRLWKHAPVFNSIFIRELMALNRDVRSRQWCDYVRAYLDRVWTQARIPDSGLLCGGGMGAYDKDVLLDHAGLTHAMLAFGSALST